jgi:hypothetical protein
VRDERGQSGFVVMTTLEDVVPDDHPLRAIRRAAIDTTLKWMNPSLDALHRPWSALDRAQLVQILCAIPSASSSSSCATI